MTNHYTDTLYTRTWMCRTEPAAKIILALPVEHVYDFGCGEAALRPLVSPPLTYTGYDTRVEAPYILPVDLNVSFPLPTEGTRDNRVAACLGVLEYIDDLQGFIAALDTHYAHVVFSYMGFRGKQRYKHYGRMIASCDTGVSRFRMQRKKVVSYSINAYQFLFYAG